MSRRVPTDDEINQAAVQLGMADANGVVRPGCRALVAKSLVDAAETERADDALVAVDSRFCERIVRIDAQLNPSLPTESIARVLAAIAPSVWRQSQESEPRT